MADDVGERIAPGARSHGARRAFTTGVANPTIDPKGFVDADLDALATARYAKIAMSRKCTPVLGRCRPEVGLCPRLSTRSGR